jgi:hypothetical protein
MSVGAKAAGAVVALSASIVVKYRVCANPDNGTDYAQTNTLDGLLCWSSTMANAVTLIAAPNGWYWIRVTDEEARTEARTLLGPIYRDQLLQKLHRVGLNDDQAATLVEAAQQTRKATMRGILPKALSDEPRAKLRPIK